MRRASRIGVVLAVAAVFGACSGAEETARVERSAPPAPPVEETARRAHEELARMGRSLSEGAAAAPSSVGAAEQQLEAELKKLEK